MPTKVESELLLTKKCLAHLVETSPAVIYSSRASGDFGATYISPNVKHQMGYVPEDFTQNESFWADHIHDKDREQVFGEARGGSGSGQASGGGAGPTCRGHVSKLEMRTVRGHHSDRFKD